jgi:hypothetical protein
MNIKVGGLNKCITTKRYPDTRTYTTTVLNGRYLVNDGLEYLAHTRQSIFGSRTDALRLEI